MPTHSFRNKRRYGLPTYIILSQISPRAFSEPNELKTLAKVVSEKIKSECPGVVWKESYATTGRFDVIDIVEADDLKQIDGVDIKVTVKIGDC